MPHRPIFHRTRQGLPGMLLLVLCTLIPSTSQAEKITVSLSQEQEGGKAGRACIYIYQGKAEYRHVKAGEPCAAEIVIERVSGRE